MRSSPIAEFLTSRWAPFAGLVLGSVAFVALIVLLVPDHFDAPPAPGESPSGVSSVIAPALPTALAPAPNAVLPTEGLGDAAEAPARQGPSERHKRGRHLAVTNPPKDPVLLPEDPALESAPPATVTDP